MKRLRILLSVVALLIMSVVVASAQDVCAPSKITNLSITIMGKTTAVVGFTAPGDDCATGTASSYQIWYSTSASFGPDNFCTGTKFTGCDPPQSAGNTECCTVTGLTCNTTYYFVVMAVDDAGNRGPFGNVVNASTTGCMTTDHFCP